MAYEGDVLTFTPFMDQERYERYLKENKKSEVTRYEVDLPSPDGAVNRLVELMLKPWF